MTNATGPTAGTDGNAPAFKLFGMRPETGRWVYILIGSVIFFFIGTIYSWSIFRGHVQKLYGASATEAGAPYMLFFAVQAAAMPFLGGVIDRMAPSRLILANGAIMSAGLFAASYARNIYEFIFAFSVVFGFGATAVYAVPIAVATKWFPDRKGLAIGLTLFGMGLAPVFMAPLAVKFISAFGVLAAFRSLGALFLAIILALSWPVRYPPDGWAPEGFAACDSSGATGRAEDMDRAGMMRTSSFAALWFCFAVASGTGLMVIGMTNQIATEVVAMSHDASALAISAFALLNGAGRPFWGYVLDRFGRNAAVVSNFTLMLAASAAMIFAREVGTKLFIAAMPVIWFCYAGWLSIAPSLTAAFFGAKNSGRNYGIVFTAFGSAAVAGNLLAGAMKDLYGDYLKAFDFIPLACAIAIAVAVVWLRPPVRPKADGRE